MASAGSGRRFFFLFLFFIDIQHDDRFLVCLQGTTNQSGRGYVLRKQTYNEFS